jgi:SAM-dependent methyltransferase
MKTQPELRQRVERVSSYPPAERERIYRKYFSQPSATARYLCARYGWDRQRILDVCCHYGYHLIHFGEGSQGVDGSPQYLQYAQEMGLRVQQANIEEPLSMVEGRFDGLLFSGTLEEILAPHVMLMRFHRLLTPQGVLCLRVPTVPPVWVDRLYRLRALPGYDAKLHLYFFTPRLLKLMVERAGYEVLEVASLGIKMHRWLSPLHGLLLPLAVTVAVMARPIPHFTYPADRAMRFLPGWAHDLAEFHQDFHERS